MLLPELEAREISVSQSVSVTESDTHNIKAQKFSSKIMVNYFYFVSLNVHKKSPILPERAKVLKNVVAENRIKNPVSNGFYMLMT